MDRVSSRELTEWQAYAQLEPFGEERNDYRMATSTTALANTLVGVITGKRGKFTIDDFLLFKDAPEKPSISDEEAAEQTARMMGAPM